MLNFGTILFLAIICGKDLAFSAIIRIYFDPHLQRQVRSSNDDYSVATAFANTAFQRLSRLEYNIMNAGNRIKNDTPIHKQMLFSRGDDRALNISKNAYIKYKASLYILNKKNDLGALSFFKTIYKKPKDLSRKAEGCSDNKYRTYDGFCNNYKYPYWGTTYTSYTRLLTPNYADEMWEPETLFKVPTIGLEIAKHVDSAPIKYSLTLVGWTNLVSYDMAHTVSYRMLHTGADIICCTSENRKLMPRHRHPLCMPLIDQDQNCFNYVRSMLSVPYDKEFGAAQQMNAVTHYLDGSTIYGATTEIAKTLRLKSKGHLRILADECKNGEPCLMAGDIRPNMDPISAALHIILMREHNRVASSLSEINPQWDDETLFQEARRIVIAELQHITYNEWLPLLIGQSQSFEAYSVGTEPHVYNSFANAAMQFVTSLFGDELRLYNEERTSASKLPMRYSFVEPKFFQDDLLMDSLIRTLATQNCQTNDLKFSEAMTKYLFSENNETGFNTISLIIQRGKDHGLPSYIKFRKLFELPNKDFNSLADDIPTQERQQLQNIYSDVNKVDLFVGGLAESPRRGALLGRTFAKIINLQMRRTRKGDNFFYDNPSQTYPFTSEQLEEIRKSSLARLLCDNSRNITKMQPNAFLVFDLDKNKLVNCKDETDIKSINLKHWKEK